MYLQAIFYCGVLASVLAAFQVFTLTNAITWRDHRVDRLLDTQVEAARETFRAALASRVEAFGPQGPFTLTTNTQPQPVCPSSTAAGSPSASPCPYDVAIEAQTAGDTQNTANLTSANTVANNLQGALFVQEQRVSAILTITLSHAGTTIGTRRELVTARTFDAAPYAVITGAVDLSATANLSSEADSGGCDPANVTSCSQQPLATQPGDTRIHAAECQQQSDGSCVFLPGADVFAPKPWDNPNQTAQQGWRY